MQQAQKINFDLAGLDLILDKEGQIWFIEANSFPGFFQDQIEERKEDLKKALGKKLIAFVPKERELRDVYVNLLKSLTDFEVIYIEDDNLPEISSNSKNTKILAWKSIWKPILAKNNYVINSPEISLLTSDKYETYMLMKNEGIKTPKTFLVGSFDEIKEIFKKGHYEKLILKPRFGCRGENIEILKKDDFEKKHIDFEKIEYILQEFIDVKNNKDLFCDYRILVAGGKYIGAIMRESSNPVVNICLGGTIHKVSKETDQKFNTIAEKIVKTLVYSFLD